MYTDQKDDRINIRVSPEQKSVIYSAAKLSGMTVTDFVVTSVFNAAHHLVADQTHFELAEDEWNEFCKLLERPVQFKKNLARLLTEPSVLELGELKPPRDKSATVPSSDTCNSRIDWSSLLQTWDLHVKCEVAEFSVEVPETPAVPVDNVNGERVTFPKKGPRKNFKAPERKSA